MDEQGREGTMADVRNKAERVFTNYLCYKVDPLWRRLPASERQLGGKEFREALHEAMGRLAVRSYLTRSTSTPQRRSWEPANTWWSIPSSNPASGI
jgi:hypothetical protein